MNTLTACPSVSPVVRAPLAGASAAWMRADNDLTPLQWSQIRAAWDGCAYCGAAGVPLQRDCVLPLSRGGRYTVENIVPACRSCNASKSNDEVTGWLRRKKLDERAFLLRHRAYLDGLSVAVDLDP